MDVFTMTKPGGTRDHEFEAYTRLLEDIGVDVANVPRIPEPGTRRRWLYAWRRKEEAEGFARELKLRTRDGSWHVSQFKVDEEDRGPVAPRPWRFTRLSRLTRGGAAPSAAAGRWSLVPAVEADMDRHDLAEAVAEQLLNRWGVLFRNLAVRDSLRLPWREIQWALRRLEDRGLVRGGRFVAGFSGEQYALPAAVEQLARVRKTPRTQERVVLNATDPLPSAALDARLELAGARVDEQRAHGVLDGSPDQHAEHAARVAVELVGRPRAPAAQVLEDP